MSDVLTNFGINHTGSLSLAISLDYDKTKAKDKLLKAGISTSKYFTALPGDYLSEATMPIDFPLFIKPTSMGNKRGVDASSVVHTYSEYLVKVESLSSTLGSRSLVESYLPGREFSVAVMQNDATKTLESLPLEIVIGKNSNGDRILGATSDSGDDEVVTMVTEPKLFRSLQVLAEKAFIELDARDYGRIDIRLDSDGVPQFLKQT